MSADALSDDKAERIAELRATYNASASLMPSNAITARSRALLSLLLAILEGKHDHVPARPAKR